jgi:hypothetical protein
LDFKSAEKQIDTTGAGNMNVNTSVLFQTPKYWNWLSVQALLGVDYFTDFSSHNIKFNMNTLGVYADDIVPSKRFKLDLGLQFNGNYNLNVFNATGLDVYKAAYGVADITGGGNLWTKFYANIRFMDDAGLAPLNLTTYIKYQMLDSLGWFESKKWLTGFVYNDAGISVGLEFGDVGETIMVADKEQKLYKLDLFIGKQFTIVKGKDYDVVFNVNGGIQNILSPKRSILLGGGASGTVGDMALQASVMFHWDNIDIAGGPLAPKTSDTGSQEWANLAVDYAGGNAQFTHEFVFDSQTLEVNAKNKLYLYVTTDNGNDADGIAFKDVNGQYLSSTARVTVDSIEVYEMPEGKLVPNANVLVGRDVVDNGTGGSLNPNALRVEIDHGTKSAVKYRIRVRLTSVLSDWPSLGAGITPSCKVNTFIRRE